MEGTSSKRPDLLEGGGGGEVEADGDADADAKDRGKKRLSNVVAASFWATRYCNAQG